MSGNTYYGHCCNRIIVSRRWKFCPNCGGPLKRNPNTGEMERTTQKTYAEGMKSFDALMMEMEDYKAQIEIMDTDNGKLERELETMEVLVKALESEIRDLEGVIALATRPEPAVPRAPDIVILTSDQPGVSGGLASIQEACGWISERGTNRGTPCIRPAEPNQKHSKGRHRYT